MAYTKIFTILLISMIFIISCSDRGGGTSHDEYEFAFGQNYIAGPKAVSSISASSLVGGDAIFIVDGIDCSDGVYFVNLSNSYVISVDATADPDNSNYWGKFDPSFVRLVEFIRLDKIRSSPIFYVNGNESRLDRWNYLVTPYGIYNYSFIITAGEVPTFKYTWYAHNEINIETIAANRYCTVIGTDGLIDLSNVQSEKKGKERGQPPREETGKETGSDPNATGHKKVSGTIFLTARGKKRG